MAKDLEKSLGEEKTRGEKERGAAGDTSGKSLGDSQTLVGGLAADDGALEDGLELTDLSARYTIVRALGQGGMGEVLLATDNRLKRQVAIKRIRGEQARSRSAITRFLAEAQAIAALNHPNIVQVYDYGRDQEGPFLIMEYVDGQSLLDRCKDNPLPLEEAVELTCELLGGLGRAHELGIIHRDIKPANILLTKDGRPKLTDFGLAKQTAADHGQTVTGAVLGTIDFMPPEQRRDATLVDAKSDLWSLAATLYQMLTGKSPKVIRLDFIPDRFTKVLGRALEEKPVDRFQSASDFRDALRGTDSTAKATSEINLIAGQCPNCQSKNSTPGRFCRECSAPLRVPCLRCNKEMPVWDKACTECGSRQAELIQARRIELQEMQSRVENLQEKGRYLEALRVIDTVGELKHPHFKDLNQWLEKLRPGLREQARHLEQAAALALEEAKAHRNAWDYRSAVQALKNLPLEARVAEHRAFMEQLQKDYSESQKIVQEIQRRVKAKQLDDLLPLVRRGLELRGDRDDLRRLVDQLEEREKFFLASSLAPPAEAIADPFSINEESIDPVLPAPSVKEWNARNWSKALQIQKIPHKRILEIVAVGISLLCIFWVLPELVKKLMPVSVSDVKNSIGMQFKLLPAGEFQMGSSSEEVGRSSNEMRHSVRISKPFYLGLGEVTQQEYERVTGKNPSNFKGPQNPVEQVSWLEAVDFCKLLSDLPEEKAAGRTYRLPTEAEWEYAYRATSNYPYHTNEAGGDLVDIAWFGLNSVQQTQGVGKRLPNRWGLYDMAGNVFEWCSDWLTDHTAQSATDPVGPAEGFNRVIRGGSWRSDDTQCRAAFRGGRPPTQKSAEIGFRVVLEVGRRERFADVNVPTSQVGKEANPASPNGPRATSPKAAGSQQKIQPSQPELKEELTNSIGIKLKLVGPGQFIRGENEQKHEVNLTTAYYLGEYEITQQQHSQVMGANPSIFKGDQNPVEPLTWHEAVDFCRKLRDLSAEKRLGHVYRLPTEAEWEFACRAGTGSLYFSGDSKESLDEYCWSSRNSGGKSQPIGQRRANAWGFFDMHGNVWEWCSDWHGNYPGGSVADPQGPGSGTHRVFRGGCWRDAAFTCRSANRDHQPPAFRYHLGLRVAMRVLVQRELDFQPWAALLNANP